jgi:hypothetical protein
MKKTKVETVYDRGEEPDTELLAALSTVETGGVAEYRNKPVMLAQNIVREALVLTRTDNTDRVLFVRPRVIHSISPDRLMGWLAVARFSEQAIGSHQFLVGRRYRAPTSHTMFAALEHAFGRAMGTSLEGALRKGIEVAEPTTIEREAFVTIPSGSRVLYVKWQGLWWPVTRYSAFSPRRADEVEAEARSARHVQVNHPDVAIV